MGEANTAAVLLDVLKERDRQNNKWGDRRAYSPLQWFAVAGEEFGEVGGHVTKGYVPPESDFDAAGYRNELIQLAAVCVAAVEGLDRDLGGSI
jgi:hypothetical protein